VIVLSRDEVDAALDKVSADSDRIAESLLEMDNHPGHQLMRAATLTGTTERRWAETSAAMTTLWDQFATYRAMLDRAKEVRARRARPGDDELAELTEILSGPVVELDAEHVPIERRGLTGPAHVAERMTLDELLARMRATFGLVTAVLATAESTWSAAIGQLEPLDTRLRDVSILAESVAAGDKEIAATVNGLRRGLDRARELVLTDVLTVSSTDPLPGLERQVGDLESGTRSPAGSPHSRRRCPTSRRSRPPRGRPTPRCWRRSPPPACRNRPMPTRRRCDRGSAG
jgi:hypothetical protein